MPEFVLSESGIEGLSTAKPQVELYDRSFPFGGSFGVRVSKTGRKAFFVVYPLHGKRKRMTLGTYPVLTVSEARKKALDILRMAQKGEDAAAVWRTYRSSDTFSDVAKRFQSEHLPKSCAPKTAAEYNRLLSKELLPLWGDRKITDIQAGEIGRFLIHVAERRKTPVLAARLRAVASSLFSFAKAQGLLVSNPVRETSSPEQKVTRERVLSIQELQSILRVLEGELPETRALFTVLILTGQRIRRVLEMRWGEVRVDRWRSSVGPKHREGFDLHLVPQVMQVLKEIRGASGDYLFSSARGGHRRSVGRAVARLNRRAGLSQRWSALDIYRTFHVTLPRLGIRPDLVDLIQGRRTFLPRTAAPSGYDYESEIRNALIVWARALILPPPQKGSSKVVPLFK